MNNKRLDGLKCAFEICTSQHQKLLTNLGQRAAQLTADPRQIAELNHSAKAIDSLSEVLNEPQAKPYGYFDLSGGEVLYQGETIQECLHPDRSFALYEEAQNTQPASRELIEKILTQMGKDELIGDAIDEFVALLESAKNE
jgi:hypothetical protein